MMHFIRPYWLFALIPAMIYLSWVIYAYQQRNPWKKVCDAHLLPSLLQTHTSKSKVFFNLSLFLFFILSIFALSGPAWNKIKLPIYRDTNALMLVLDLSDNMRVSDLKPDRLSRAKFKIRDLINATQNTQMGLVVFTQEAFVVSPLSQDANTLNALIDELHPHMMPISGSDIGQGLLQGSTLLKQAGVEQGHLLLLTASEPSATSFDAAKQIAQAGNHLHVLAMLPEKNQSTLAKLKQLAEVGNGELVLFTPDSTDINKIIHRNQAPHISKNEKVENAILWQDAGPWVCLLLIPFALFLLREKVWYERHH